MRKERGRGEEGSEIENINVMPGLCHEVKHKGSLFMIAHSTRTHKRSTSKSPPSASVLCCPRLIHARRTGIPLPLKAHRDFAIACVCTNGSTFQQRNPGSMPGTRRAAANFPSSLPLFRPFPATPPSSPSHPPRPSNQTLLKPTCCCPLLSTILHLCVRAASSPF